MSKKENRDELIQKKVKELTKRKEELEKIIEDSSKGYETNLILWDENNNKSTNLRIFISEETLVNKYASLVGRTTFLMQATKELLKKDISRDDVIVSGFKFSSWRNDFEKLITKINASAELEKIKNGLDQLPNFYTDEKKDEDKFNALLDSLN